MSGPNQNIFIGPLKPGQKPPIVAATSQRFDNWSVLDLLKDHDKNSTNNSSNSLKARKPKKITRAAGGTVWEDPTLADWDTDDYRAFVGDLGNDITDEMLINCFKSYPSFLRAKVIKKKGYGFVSFKDPQDYANAIKTWDGKYLGSRPIKLRKSNWKDRCIEARRNKS